MHLGVMAAVTLVRRLVPISLVTSGVVAATGVALMLANLLLARVLPPPALGTLTLAVALIAFGFTVGPLGLDRLAVRDRMGASRRLLAWAIANGAIVASFTVVVATIAYDLSSEMGALIALGIIAGATTLLAAGVLQASERHLVSAALAGSSNVALLAVAISAAAAGASSVGGVLAAYALGLVVVAISSWFWLLDQRQAFRDLLPSPRWREGMALTGLVLLGASAGVLERLLVPLVLDIADLARLAILTSLVIGPFRMLQIGVGRTLMPNLRNAPNQCARRRVLRRELITSAIMAFGFAVGLWYMAPLIVEATLADDYAIDNVLLGAGIFAGLVRVGEGLGLATISALADVAALERAHILGWLSLALAIAGGVAGSRFGLAGLVVGTNFGTLIYVAVLGSLTRQALSE